VPPRKCFRCWLLPKAAFSDEQFNLAADFFDGTDCEHRSYQAGWCDEGSPADLSNAPIVAEERFPGEVGTPVNRVFPLTLTA
jgi:hypothetical protein